MNKGKGTLAAMLCQDGIVNDGLDGAIGEHSFQTCICKFVDIHSVPSRIGLEINLIAGLLHEWRRGLCEEIKNHLILRRDNQGLRMNLKCFLIGYCEADGSERSCGVNRYLDGKEALTLN
jgi:hypothetical protein